MASVVAATKGNGPIYLEYDIAGVLSDLERLFAPGQGIPSQLGIPVFVKLFRYSRNMFMELSLLHLR